MKCCGRAMAAALVLLLVPIVACAAETAARGLRPGAFSLGVHAVQHTFDAMRVGDVRPTQHSDFGGRAEIAYAALPWLEVTASAYRGVSHFDFDTAFDKGKGRDSDWSVDIGSDLLLGQTGSARVFIGGAYFYGEARSRTTIDNPTMETITLEGPRTFMAGGTARLLATRQLFGRVEGVAQLSTGVMRARGHARPSGILYEWNGRTFSAALGLRTELLSGR
jgi:hypothetical protein